MQTNRKALSAMAAQLPSYKRRDLGIATMNYAIYTTNTGTLCTGRYKNSHTPTFGHCFVVCQHFSRPVVECRTKRAGKVNETS